MSGSVLKSGTIVALLRHSRRAAIGSQSAGLIKLPLVGLMASH